MEHTLDMIDEHLLVAESISIDYQNEAIDMSWHFASALVREVADVPLELILRDVLEVEVAKEDVNYRSTLGV